MGPVDHGTTGGSAAAEDKGTSEHKEPPIATMLVLRHIHYQASGTMT